MKVIYKAVSNEKIYEPQIDSSAFYFRSKFIIYAFENNVQSCQ